MIICKLFPILLYICFGIVGYIMGFKVRGTREYNRNPHYQEGTESQKWE